MIRPRFLRFAVSCPSAPHFVKTKTPRGICLCLGRWQIRLARRP